MGVIQYYLLDVICCITFTTGLALIMAKKMASYAYECVFEIL